MGICEKDMPNVCKISIANERIEAAEPYRRRYAIERVVLTSTRTRVKEMCPERTCRDRSGLKFDVEMHTV